MESLNILNGSMTPKYEKYNDLYTVNITSDINKLKIDYTLEENEQVNVYGNIDLNEGQNKVILAIKKNNEEIEYITLMVNKDQTESVSILNTENIALEINRDNYLPSYAPYLIGLSCFSIILLIFCIFYLRKRNN